MALNLNLFKIYKIWSLMFINIIVQNLNAQSMIPTELAQAQLVAYNNQNLEEFLKCYSEDVQVFNFPNDLVYEGIANMRDRYQKAWKLNPNQKAEITKRINVGNTVVDEEFITGRSSGIDAHVIAIYKIENGKIKQVYFIRE